MEPATPSSSCRELPLADAVNQASFLIALLQILIIWLALALSISAPLFRSSTSLASFCIPAQYIKLAQTMNTISKGESNLLNSNGALLRRFQIAQQTAAK